MTGMMRRWFALGGGALLVYAVLVGFHATPPEGAGQPSATFVVR